MNDCSPVNYCRSEVAERTFSSADPGPTGGRPMSWREVTGESISTSRRGTGPGIQGKTRRDNVGKDHLPAGIGNNLRGPIGKGNWNRWEGFGLAHEPV